METKLLQQQLNKIKELCFNRRPHFLQQKFCKIKDSPNETLINRAEFEIQKTNYLRELWKQNYLVTTFKIMITKEEGQLSLYFVFEKYPD